MKKIKLSKKHVAYVNKSIKNKSLADIAKELSIDLKATEENPFEKQDLIRYFKDNYNRNLNVEKFKSRMN